MSDFKVHFRTLLLLIIIIIDEHYAKRGVVVCWEGAVSYLSCLIYLCLLALLVCLLAYYTLLCFPVVLHGLAWLEVAILVPVLLDILGFFAL